MSAHLIFPFLDELQSRPPEDVVVDEVFRDIPALNHLAAAVLTVSNKMSHASRNALLLGDGTTDPQLRVLQVEVGMIQRDQIENAVPDLDYLKGQAPQPRQAFETPDNDIWFPNPN